MVKIQKIVIRRRSIDREKGSAVSAECWAERRSTEKRLMTQAYKLVPHKTLKQSIWATVLKSFCPGAAIVQGARQGHAQAVTSIKIITSQFIIFAEKEICHKRLGQTGSNVSVKS